MVDVQNRQVLDDLAEKIKESNPNVLPKTIGDKIMPVIEVGDNIDQRFIIHTNSATSGTITITTTPTDKDFYLTGIEMSYATDATCDMASAQNGVIVIIQGVSRVALSFANIALTAQQSDRSITFPVPILLDRGSLVTMTGTFTVGVAIRGVSISGYSVDTLQKV